MTTQKLLKISRWTSLLSFVVGSVLFWTYYFAEYGELILIGIAYVFIVGVINIILITLVHSRWTKAQTERRDLYRTGMLMLLNIPVFLFYLFMTSKLLGTIRLTLTNETGSKLSYVDINGCEHKKISELEPGEKVEVWIGIPTDCNIEISYLTDGKPKSEIVYGTSTGCGSKTSFIIGKDKGLQR